MVELSGGNKKRKLPPRYPREREIMVFGEINELDHVLELLSDLGKYLSTVPNTITVDEWGRICIDPLTYLVKVLRRAYVEYERFWRHDGWKLEDDSALSRDLADFGNMRWRVKEIEDAPYYDPAQLACAQSLYTALALMQCPGGKDWVDHCIGSLRQELTRYHAAALEVLLGRNAVFASGRKKGARSKAVEHIFNLAKDNRCASAKELLAKANKSIIGAMSHRTFFNRVSDARNKYPKEKPTK